MGPALGESPTSTPTTTPERGRVGSAEISRETGGGHWPLPRSDSTVCSVRFSGGITSFCSGGAFAAPQVVSCSDSGRSVPQPLRPRCSEAPRVPPRPCCLWKLPEIGLLSTIPFLSAVVGAAGNDHRAIYPICRSILILTFKVTNYGRGRDVSYLTPPAEHRGSIG